MSDQLASDLVALHPYLVQRAKQFGLSRHDAEDVVQDVILSALMHARGLAGDDLGAWCRVVLRNRVFGLRRTLQARRTVSAPSGDEMLEQAMMPAQDHVVLLKQTIKVMAAMPAHAARLITSIRVEGRSFEEAAALERVPLGTIKSRLHRAHAKLCRDLDRPLRRPCA